MVRKLPVLYQTGEFVADERLPSGISLDADISLEVVQVAGQDELAERLVDAEMALILVNGDRAGIDTLVAAKAQLPSRPVLMICDHGQAELLREALEHGLDGYVARHDTWEQTRSILDVMLRRWAASAEASAEAAYADSEPSPRPDIEAGSFWAFFDSAPIGIKILDQNNVVLYGNRRLQTMLGYSDAELRLMTERQLIHPDDRSIGRNSFEMLARGEADFAQATVRHRSKTGETIWTGLGRVALRDEHNEVRYVLETVVDLSPGQPHEPRASFLDELSRGIAHDLRNILSLISMESQVAREAQPASPLPRGATDTLG